MFAHDLKPLDILNFLIKYADDATLLSPQHSKTSVELEMATGAEQTEAPPTCVAVLRTPAVRILVRTFDQDGAITRHE